jgi:hypothetical protein
MWKLLVSLLIVLVVAELPGKRDEEILEQCEETAASEFG